MTAPAMTLTLTAPKASTANVPEPTAHVQVWFGRRLLIDWEGDPDTAPKIAAGLQRQYRGLRVCRANGSDW